ncbi:MAG: FHA domain-containing protein [Candidatus Sumerlaeia bacterium]|nr:FHA domain-containing protein [Candidatus Sumerlaeia bacterium]
MSQEQARNGPANSVRLCLRPLQAIPGLQPVYPLESAALTIGRHPSNHICVPVEAVSRYHARIEKQGDRWVVVDLGSSNGTFIRGQRIEQAALEPGLTVQFGNVEFRCEGLEAAAGDEYGLKTPVEFVAGDRHQSHFILQAEAGRREAIPGKIIEVPPDPEALVKAYRRLAVLYKLSDLLRSAPEEPQLLECFMDLIFQVVPADRGVILMRAAPDEELQIRVARTREHAQPKTPIAVSRTIIDKCMEERLAILSQDAVSDARFKASESIVLHDIRSTMVVPLVSGNAILGVIHLDTRESVRAFNDDDLHFVTSLADDLALYLDHRRVLEESVRNQEMAAVGEVITDLAHNIKNVLLLAEGSIKLMDRLIDSGDLARVRENWTLTQRTLARISTMVKEMLDYSRAPQIVKTQCNLNTLVREQCHSYRSEFEKKGIKVKLRLDRRIEDCMLDAHGLERALLNLLVNACEAIQHDHGENQGDRGEEGAGDTASGGRGRCPPPHPHPPKA